MPHKSFVICIGVGLTGFIYLSGCGNAGAGAMGTSLADREKYHALDLKNEIDPRGKTGSDPESIVLRVFPPLNDRGVRETLSVRRVDNARLVVFMTRAGLPDDSVRAVRYRADFEPDGANLNQWRLTWAGRQYQCQSGRGSQDWSSNLCF